MSFVNKLHEELFDDLIFEFTGTNYAKPGTYLHAVFRDLFPLEKYIEQHVALITEGHPFSPFMSRKRKIIYQFVEDENANNARG